MSRPGATPCPECPTVQSPISSQAVSTANCQARGKLARGEPWALGRTHALKQGEVLRPGDWHISTEILGGDGPRTNYVFGVCVQQAMGAALHLTTVRPL